MLALIRTLLGAQIFAAQAARLRVEANGIISRAILMMVVALFATIAVGFFTTAAYIILVQTYDIIYSLLIISGSYLALALITYCIAIFSYRAALYTQKKEHESVTTTAKDAFHSFEEIIGQIKPLELAQKSGEAIAQKVGPLPLTGLAILAGYLLARRGEK